MEVTKGQSEVVRFSIPKNLTAATYKVLKDDVAVGSNKNALITPGTGVAVCALPYSLLSETGQFKVVLSFSYNDTFTTQQYEKTEIVYVVVPILNEIEIREVHPHATDDEVHRIEKAARHIINAHTGQRFTLFRGERIVRGSGTRALFLPERLISLETVNGGSPTNYRVDSDGHVLRFFPWGVPPVKADAYGLHMHTGGVIHNPNGVHLGTFDPNRNYEIVGSWGWDEVPPPVKEAAKLLVNDYACADNAYRDRFLTSMTAADWRIQFNSGAFHKTGNVRADQLLSDYVLKRGWAVI